MQKIHLKNAFYFDLQIKLQPHFLEAKNWEHKPKQCIMKNQRYNPLIILLNVVSNKPSTT
jgi:hypothetical protein